MTAENGVAKTKKRLTPDETRIRKLENDVANMKNQIGNLDSKVMSIYQLKWSD